jgi:hypothetical protein
MDSKNLYAGESESRVNTRLDLARIVRNPNSGGIKIPILRKWGLGGKTTWARQTVVGHDRNLNRDCEPGPGIVVIPGLDATRGYAVNRGSDFQWSLRRNAALARIMRDFVAASERPVISATSLMETS